jgi:D-sedoheptulose 7-phosphate isomerase
MTAFDIETFWDSETREHLNAAQMTFASLQPVFGQWLAQGVRTVQGGGKILFFGNGGSASDAQHLATELTVRFIKDRAPIPAIALTTDTSALTAIGNDLGFDHLFSRQVDALGRKGDMAVGISTSGNSPNVLKALWTARDRGLVTVGLAGRDGGKMHDCCDIMIVVPSQVTARIQEMHITLGHLFCGGLEQSLGLV